jgi:peptidyl-prolyl cis-trans isomerase A (cyclophilin A)
MKYIFCLFVTILFAQCITNEPEKKQVEKEIVTTQQAPEEKKPIWLTDDNCAKFLEQYGKENPETDFIISTEFGEIEITLYNTTPLHRASFIYLIKEKQYFDKTYFYRVVKDFIAQAGNRDDERTQEKRFLIGKYTIPAEINSSYFHQVGAVSMARNYDNNPDKRSSPYDFFIITGKKHTDFGLDMTEKEYDLKLSEEQRKTYMSLGGSPHLDGGQTIVGHVTKGLGVAKTISAQKTDGSDWPLKNIPLTIKLKQ